MRSCRSPSSLWGVDCNAYAFNPAARKDARKALGIDALTMGRALVWLSKFGVLRPRRPGSEQP
jgi:hypothetical protein